MRDENDIPLPSIPDADGPAAFISAPDAEDILPDLSHITSRPDAESLAAFAYTPGIPPIVAAGYATKGEEGMSEVESKLRDRASNADSGKIRKYGANYFPQTPIPFGAWEYKCETCRFYQHDHSDGPSHPQCEVVGHPGDALGGENIHPDGWCAFWLPKPGVGWLEYVTDRLEGEVSN